MTTRQGLTVVGQVIGAYFGPVGSAIGGAIGGFIGGEIDGPQKGPRLDDTNAPAIEFGAKCPRVYGRVWATLSPLWWSKLRESTVNSGGKGAADQTTDNYVYHCDILGRLADGANVIAWTRIRIDGKIVATQLATSSPESIAATITTDRWGDVELRSGGPTQAPWSVMEASVGAGNCSAYRDQCTFGITNLLMPNGRNPALIEVEVITAGTQADAATRLETYFDGGNSEDISAYALGAGTLTSTGGGIDPGGTFFTVRDETCRLFWESAALAGDGVSPVVVEGFVTFASSANFTAMPFVEYVPNTALYSSTFWRLQFYGTGGRIDLGTPATNEPLSVASGRTHFEIHIGVSTFYVFLAGVLVFSGASGVPGAATTGRLTLGNPVGINEAQFEIDEFAVRFRAGHTASFIPPEHIDPPDGQTWTPGTEDLQTVLEAEMLRCAPLTIDHLDMSAAAGKEVWGFKASRSAAAECGVLLDWYYLDIFCGDKITLVERGGAVEQTIPYGYTGAGMDSAGDPFAGLTRGADVESQFATSVQYINILADGEVDTQQSQRVGAGSEVRAVNFSIYSKPTLAKGRADTITQDTRVAAHTATVHLGAIQAASIQPGSVLALVDNKGNSYRTRVLRLVWNRGVYDVDVCLDDPNILSTVGITAEVDTSVIEVAPPAVTEILLFDGPIFRDVDDDPGFYAFAKGSPQGSKLMNSTDGGVTYTEVAAFTTQSVFGTCSSILGDSTVGWVFDETSTVTVNVGAGSSLSSTTKAAMLADQSVNPYAIGVHGRWEVGQFRTATLLSAGVYTLSGLLRGLRGTEWAIPLHAAGDKFVLITAAARRVEKQASEIGIEELYKGVTAGRTLTSATAQMFTNDAVGLECFAPVHLRVARSSGGAYISWTPRTRYATRFASPLGIYAPLGEAAESYDVELRDGSNALVASDTVSTPLWQVSAASVTGALAGPANELTVISGEIVGVSQSVYQFVRFDAAGATVLGTSPYLAGVVYQACYDGDELYAATSEADLTNDRIQRVTRTAMGSVAATYAAATNSVKGVACDGSNVWFVEYTTGLLRKLNKTTLASVATYAFADAGSWARLLHDAGSLWICNSLANEVIQWDIATTTELQRFSVVDRPVDLLVVGGLIFVRGIASIACYDTTTGALVETGPTLAGNKTGLYEFGAYVAVASDTNIHLLDSSTGVLAKTIETAYTLHDGVYYTWLSRLSGVVGSVLYVTMVDAGRITLTTLGFELTAPDLTGHSVTVWQNSAVVGRGYPATLEL